MDSARGCGIGLKPAHWRDLIQTPRAVPWVEIHAENFFGAGGPPHRALTAIRADHALSIHGVGMSPGSADGIDNGHLAAFAALVRRYEPGLVSEHLAWNKAGGRHVPDLLPLTYDDETLDVVVANILRIQDALMRTILIETPTRYEEPGGDPLAEAQFLTSLVARTGCGLLLDVNNVFISAHNLEFSALDYVRALPLEAVAEIHLAGHDEDPSGLLIDSHRGPVAAEVWALFHQIGIDAPCLIEWDADIPAFDRLVAEAAKADARANAA